MSSDDSAPNPTRRASVVPLLPVWRVDRAFDYTVPDSLLDKVWVGSLVRVPFGRRKVRGIVTSLDEDDDDSGRSLETIGAVVVDPPLAPPPLDALLDWLARRYAVARGVAFSRVVPPRVRVAKLTVDRLAQPASSEGEELVSGYTGGERLLNEIRSKKSGVWSFRSLPGDDRGRLISGLIAAVAHADGTALITVPEVRYGSAVLDSIEKDWPGLARVDSSQEENDRARAWVSLASGHGLGAGGRATVLTPTPGLRLLVVDEEHHSSYKEDRSPRYDARRVAIERARLQGAICVLISATPTLESGFKVRAGDWQEVSPERAARRAARPIVEVVPPSERSALSQELHARVRDTLRANRRVGLLVPSRGFSRALWCASCKKSLRCPVCEAGLFYERKGTDRAGVRCVRCGLQKPAPDVCPNCGASDWRYVGAGSERLADQIAKAFPRARVRRADPDVLAGGESRQFSDSDIYVTTWIGTKPALRPEVGLVGVVNADALIRRPEYGASESAYQALSEMAEWAGPASTGGRLVIQSSEPTHHSVQAVVRADHDFFVTRELEMRRDPPYPPYLELLKITASGDQAEATITKAAEAAKRCRAEVLGPISVYRSSGESSSVDREILVKCKDALPIAEALRQLLAETPPGALKVDVDPA